MRIFIAGATGTLGLPLVRALLARGHAVTGLTRSPARGEILARMGAGAAVADALDAAALRRVLGEARPTHVVHALTALPARGPLRATDLTATNALRVAGTGNLLEAAIAAGARRIVGESMIFAYGYGDHGSTPKTETDPLQEVEPHPGLQPTVNAVRSLESQLSDAHLEGRIETVSLRYGVFYGPDCPSTRVILRLLRWRMIPRVRGSNGVWSFIHVADAVAAAVAALERGSAGRVYNVVDDEPVGMNEFLVRAAEAVGAPRPPFAPEWMMRLATPYAARAVATRLPVCNARAKRELDWTPEFPTTREGLAQVARAARAGSGGD